MQSKNKFFSILALAIAVIAFSTFTFAQDAKTDAEKGEKKAARAERGEKRGRGDHGMGRRGFAGHRGKMAGGMMMMRGIDLTDAQKDQIKALRASNKPDQVVRDEVRSLMKAKKDGTLTAEQTTRFKAIHEEGIAKQKAMHEQVQNILTAEQKAQIETRKAEMKTRMQDRKQKFEQRRKAKPADATKPTI
ncbi:MAG: Spy/CpxP family protein refolding chaperone [Pyrinomonadaceae bacterium]